MSQYFDNDKNIKSEKRLIKFNFGEIDFSMYTDNGVFSKNKFDYGTRLLLENIDINGISGKVLDLGCGTGVVGVVLGKINKNVFIDMVDVNERALKLAKDNVIINNLDNRVFNSDIYSNIDDKYDYIITNPPIRAGKEVIKKFLYGAKDYLNDDGMLYFVMRKDHGVKSMIKYLEDIYDIEVICKDKGFYIVRCKKNNV